MEEFYIILEVCVPINRTERLVTADKQPCKYCYCFMVPLR